VGLHTDIIQSLVKKTLYVGAFAFIFGNFAMLSTIVFDSFATLGLNASAASFSPADLMKPGLVAAEGLSASQPIFDHIGTIAPGPFEFFGNLAEVILLCLGGIIVIAAFFVLSIQLFVLIIEFKLTTLAGFVLVPFAFWRQTTFLAERVLGNVISSGIKVLVIAIVIGIGSTMFETLRTALDPDDMTIEQAFAVVLGALTLMGLAIFCPRIAAGLVSGAPQLSAGAQLEPPSASPPLAPPPWRGRRPSAPLAAPLRSRKRAASAASIGDRSRLCFAQALPVRSSATQCGGRPRRRRRRRRAPGCSQGRQPLPSPQHLRRPRGHRRIWRRYPGAKPGRRRGIFLIRSARLGETFPPRPADARRRPDGGAYHRRRRWRRRIRRPQPQEQGVDPMFARARSSRFQKTTEPDTPYREAQQLWDRRMGAAMDHARTWRTATFGLISVAGFLAAAVAFLALRPAAVPFVIEASDTGEARLVGPRRPTSRATPRYPAPRPFVEMVRGLPSDPIVVRQNWLRAMIGRHRAARRFNAMAADDDPFAKVGKTNIAVEVLSVVRASPTSFNLRWRESTYMSGTLTHVERFTGVATIVIDPPSTPERLSKNPLGLYVHAFTWSRDLQQ
jgi:type IV secretion system protein TrbL